jgi:hypothetical protein
MNDSLILDDLRTLNNQIEAGLLAWDQTRDLAPLRLAMKSLWAIALVYDFKTFDDLTHNADL